MGFLHLLAFTKGLLNL